MTITNRQKKIAVAFAALLITLALTVANHYAFDLDFASIELWIGTLIIFFPIYFFYTGSLSIKIISVFATILAMLTYFFFVIGLSLSFSIIFSVIIIMLIFSFFLIS